MVSQYRPAVSACQCIGQPLFRTTHKFKLSVPCVRIVAHTVCLTLAPMGAEDDKALCHTLKRLLPPLSIIDGCRSDEGPKGTWSAAFCGSFCLAAEALSWRPPKH